MATGVFRTADRMESDAQKKKREQEELKKALDKVDWGALAKMGQTQPKPVAGGRGTAVNTVGQAGGVRPGTTSTPNTSLMSPGYGRAGIVEPSTPARSSRGRTVSRRVSADTAEALGAQRTTGAPWLPGGYVGGPDRVLANGGGVVDGFYIPPGLTFTSGSNNTPSSGDSTPGGGNGGNGGNGGTPGSVNIPGLGGDGGASTLPSADSITSELLSEFEKIAAEEQARINAAGEKLLADLGMTDPMAAFQWNTANVGVPRGTMDNYFAAQGWDTGEIDTTRQVEQDLLNAFLGDTGQFASGVAASGQNWRTRQMDMAKQLQADATRQLALNAMAARMGVQANDAQRRQDLANSILSLALEYGKIKQNGSGLSITSPNIPTTGVTLPDGRVVQLPSTLFN